MRKRTLAALAVLTLWAHAAPAQVPNFPQTLPPNTVVGRLAIGPGPSQAVPFGALAGSGAFNSASWAIAGGTADAITATLSPALAALNDGQLVYFRATAANATTTPTFSPNGLTARVITKRGGTALAVADIPAANAETILRYNLANTRWELLNPQAGAGGGTVNTGVAGQVAYYSASTNAVDGNPNLRISGGDATVGLAGSVVGTWSFANATSGSIKVSPTTGALGTSVLTLPARTANVATSTGATTNGNCAKFDASGNLVDNGAPCAGGAATLTVGSTAITAGTTTRVLFDNAGTLGEYAISGSGNVAMTTSPTLVTPALGVATATSVNGNTLTTGTYTLTGGGGKTLTFNNTMTMTATDGSTVAFGGGGTVSYTIASGTAALGTSAIASATCATVVTASATGVATTDIVTASFNGDPTAVTGYVPLTTGMLTIIPYPTVNTVNFKVCNNTSSSITPGAITLNYRVNR